MLNVRQRRSAQAKAEVAELIADYGPGRSEALLNVHRTTILRWAEGHTEPPTAVLIALRAACKGQLPGMEVRHWEGWSFGLNGLLYAPNGRASHAGDIMAQQYERALIQALRVENKELRAKLARATQGGLPAANDGDLTVTLQSDTGR